MHRDRHIRIRSVRRETPDLRKLSEAVIALAQAQLEKEAAAEHQARRVTKPPKPSPRQRPPKGQRQ